MFGQARLGVGEDRLVVEEGVEQFRFVVEDDVPVAGMFAEVQADFLAAGLALEVVRLAFHLLAEGRREEPERLFQGVFPPGGGEDDLRAGLPDERQQPF